MASNAHDSDDTITVHTPSTMSEYTVVDIQQIIAGDVVLSPVQHHQSPNAAAIAKQLSQAASSLSAAAPQTTVMSLSNITLDDSTPSDSGVQLLDSVSSMNASLMSGSGLEFDLTPCSISSTAAAAGASAAVLTDSAFSSPTAESVAAAADLQNSNVPLLAATGEPSPMHVSAHSSPAAGGNAIPDEMKTSVCSTFDAEPIVYRRKTKKPRQHSSSSGPKKRVSFHEDILNSTKTDNIHIEHGFITYKGGPARKQQAGRYSWCADGAGGAHGGGAAMDRDDDEEYAENGQYYYRNACSDVLDYGKTDLYERETLGLQADHSGVFEYGPPPLIGGNSNANAGRSNEPPSQPRNGDEFYKCNCTSSNSSLSDDSSTSGTDHSNGNLSAAAQRNYGQAKSNSCDCIGVQPNIGGPGAVSNTMINDNCYYSEPNIDGLDDHHNRVMPTAKSVWSKELKPKSSCLKTTGGRRQTGVIQEYDLSQKVKTFNVHHKLMVPDMSKNIFGSLKQIFTMPLPERGVPEGCEDLHSVFECLPEVEHCSPAHKQHTHHQHHNPQTVQTARTFLSKSFDGGLAKGSDTKTPKKYVHNVDQQLRHNNSAPTTKKMVAGSPRDTASMLGSSGGSDARSVADPMSCSTSPTATQTRPKQQQQQPHASPAQQSSNTATPPQSSSPSSFRNKYIINCESTVFEHTGVSYEADSMPPPSCRESATPQSAAITAPSPATASPQLLCKPTTTSSSSFSVPVPFRKKLSNIIRSFRDTDSNKTKSGELPIGILPSPSDVYKVQEDEIEQPEEFVPLSDEDDCGVPQVEFKVMAPLRQIKPMAAVEPKAPPPKATVNVVDAPIPAKYDCIQYSVPMSMDTSMRSDFSSVSNSANEQQTEQASSHTTTTLHPNNGQTAATSQSSPARSRHLVSPMRKKTLTTRFERTRMSPDLFGGGRESNRGCLSDEFDDILTITTTHMGHNDGGHPADASSSVVHDLSSSDSELVIVDYPDQHEFRQHEQKAAAKAPSMSGSTASSSKSSLINRFLRNVTQKKIADATIQKNVVLANKVRSERKLCDTLYVKGVRPRNPDLIEDLNAEIALELEMSGCGGGGSSTGATNTIRQQQQQQQQPHQMAAGAAVTTQVAKAEFGLGVGEISADLFAAQRLHIFRDDRETLMKVFKLYTGYSLEGHMTPVLVFLTDKTLYVADMIRSRLFNKFVLPYTELDVILIGPHGNTVLLSNSARDMQQVLLAGGPYPADGLVSSLEMCARRGGSVLPAVGQLTLDHLAPLQQFVRENSSVGKNDPWIYYAVVSVPANLLNHDVEPLGPHIKGPLMFRNVLFKSPAQQWQAGYFLLKAGVLYMFNDAQHRIPSLVLGMYECKGARRAATATRPHCFELMLKTGFMQLAAPDEYVASDWLQALVQAASGLFEMQERHKALGCTLVLTSNHLITLREDFTAPLRRVNSSTVASVAAVSPRKQALDRSLRKLSDTSTFNDTSSNISSSTARFSDSRRSSAISSPTRSDDGRSARNTLATVPDADEQGSTTSMSSIYGKNSGVEIKTCAALQEISSVRIPSQGDSWWCILEFSCQEVRETSGDMVVFFATNSDMRRFLTMFETLWQTKNDTGFPLSILADDDAIGAHCSDLFRDINKSWDPLISAALGYPQ